MKHCAHILAPWPIAAESNTSPAGSSSSLEVPRIVVEKHHRGRLLSYAKSKVRGREESSVILHKAQFRRIQHRVDGEQPFKAFSKIRRPAMLLIGGKDDRKTLITPTTDLVDNVLV